jgi:hypothetical protein
MIWILGAIVVTLGCGWGWDWEGVKTVTYIYDFMVRSTTKCETNNIVYIS